MQKRCCGKHKCNQVCCIDVDHICHQRCSGTMSCGKHRCELLCHRGKCGKCLQSSEYCTPFKYSYNLGCGTCGMFFFKYRNYSSSTGFEELYCHCRSSVIYPPVPCGAKPPVCDKPCRRQHDCDHPPLHTCHSDRECPPCIVFTDKLCFGGHEVNVLHSTHVNFRCQSTLKNQMARLNILCLIFLGEKRESARSHMNPQKRIWKKSKSF